MIQDMRPTEDEQKLMAKYDITLERKSVYFYQGYRYERLSDAVRYATDSLAPRQARVSATD